MPYTFRNILIGNPGRIPQQIMRRCRI